MNAHGLKTPSPSSQLIAYLFVFLAALQLLDWHSTATAIESRQETNEAINWLSALLGFQGALALMKLGCLVVVGGLYRQWRSSVGYNGPFIFALVLTDLSYLAVVLNNYQ